MSMTSNPTTDTAKTYAAWMASQAGKYQTDMGYVFSAKGTRVRLMFGQADHQMMMSAEAGGEATPAVRFQRLEAWMKNHAGHALTRIGPAANARGTMDCWYCQVDHEVCMDNVT